MALCRFSDTRPLRRPVCESAARESRVCRMLYVCNARAVVVVSAASIQDSAMLILSAGRLRTVHCRYICNICAHTKRCGTRHTVHHTQNMNKNDAQISYTHTTHHDATPDNTNPSRWLRAGCGDKRSRLLIHRHRSVDKVRTLFGCRVLLVNLVQPVVLAVYTPQQVRVVLQPLS